MCVWHLEETDKSELEMKMDEPEGTVPWWDPAKEKAYRPGIETPETALAVIPGLKGFAIAVFQGSVPVEVFGLTNTVVQALGAKMSPLL